ncbi:MAG TPA: hypothetical protein VEG34_14005 [Thermoanaerobaculia bacterium]|nr:hypothetical protein [Thermoanaerobaculia bacterium]
MRMPVPALFRRTLAAACWSALSAIAAIAALVASAPAAAQDLTHPLTAAEVECSELQLERLAARFAVEPGEARTANLLLAPGFGDPSYQGLAVASQTGTAAMVLPERHLAFHVAQVRSLLANPARPPLGQVSLTREEPASNLVPPASVDTLTVVLDPSLTPPAPALQAVIDNVTEPAGRGTATRPGRGLEEGGLLTPCTGRLTPFDRQVFALLQRLVRVETRFFFGGFQETDSLITLFRGADPHVYRLNAYGGTDGKVAVEIEVGWTPDGRLTTAALRLLPQCPVLVRTPGCTDKFAVRPVETRVWLAPPVLGGAGTWSKDDPRTAQLFHATPAGTWITEDTADLAALLTGTAWTADSEETLRRGDAGGTFR